MARKKNDANTDIVREWLPSIRERLAVGEKPTAIAAWLSGIAGFAGTEATLNGYLRALSDTTSDPIPIQPAAPARRRIGYARVSTDDQNLNLQLDALVASGIPLGDIYQEKISGSRSDRPELDHAIKALRSGDVLVVWRLDRLGRSLADLVKIVADLEAKGVGFESLTEKIDTTSAAGKLMLHVFAALAEFERNIIRERTKAGLTAARARGRKGGRKPSLTEKQVREIRALLRDANIQATEVAKQYGVSRSTLYKHAGVVLPDNVALSKPRENIRSRRMEMFDNATRTEGINKNK